MSGRPTDRPLACRLGPGSLEAFVATSWGSTPHHWPGTDRPGFDGLPSFADLEQLLLQIPIELWKLTTAPTDDGPVLAAKTEIGSDERARTVRRRLVNDAHGRPLVAAARDALRNGESLVLRHLRSVLPTVAAMCRELESCVGLPVAANLFVTPAGATGFPWHYDASDALFVQLEGSKRWRLCGPAVDSPRSGGEVPAPLNPPDLEAVLEPGSVLHVPQGWVHRGEAGPNGSMHLTIGTQPVRVVDLLHRLVDAAAEAEPALRRTVSAWEGPTADELLETFGGLVEAGGDTLPPISERHWADELAALPTDAMPMAADLLRGPPTLDSVLVVSGSLPMRVVGDGVAGTIRLVGVGGSITAAAAARPAFDHVVSSPRFRVGDLPTPLDDAARLDLAEQLVIQGLCHIE